QVVVGRRRDGLDHEDVAAADVLGDLDLHLPVAEPPDLGPTQRYPNVTADRLRQRAVRIPREQLDLVLHRARRASISRVGGEGVDPSLPDPKSGALPAWLPPKALSSAQDRPFGKRRRVVSGPREVNTGRLKLPGVQAHARARPCGGSSGLPALPSPAP